MLNSNFKEINVFFSNLPEVKAEKGILQNKHHEFDVFEHTKKFVDYVSELTEDKNIIVAGWLHDIGKPITAKVELDKDNKPVENESGKPYHNFYNHENIGKDIVDSMDKKIFKKFGLDKEKISILVGYHYLPMIGIKELRKTENFKDFVLSFNKLDNNLSNLEVAKKEILTMFLADKLAQGKFCMDKNELFLIRETLLKNNRTESDLRKIYDMQKTASGKKG